MRVQENINLATIANFRVGGTARYLIDLENVNELTQLASFVQQHKLPLLIIGKTTNMLLSDNNIEMIAVRFSPKNIMVKRENSQSVVLSAEAGANWDAVVEYAVSRNLQGIESLSGIPGSAGAAPVQNIGAYGQEFSQVADEVRVFDLEKKCFRNFTAAECKFSYRDSLFKHKQGRYVVTSITMRLHKNSPPPVVYDSLNNYLIDKNITKPTLRQIRDAVLEIRKQKFGSIEGLGTVGSFFKNVYISNSKLSELREEYPDIPYINEGERIKLFSGWLIEQTGWKGKNVGNVGVSENNALVLQNLNGKARAKEIYSLAQVIKKDVSKKFGITLQEEVCLIGF